ncbi:MAG TPA: M48 family metalloprotease [Longimicrobiaceae bacterium]|nr:M48 family metalloprotease [Longimicrobiaceae bacterium]
MITNTRRRIRALVPVALCLATLSTCARNPVTGRTQLALISESQEIAMGRESAEQIGQALGLVDDPQLQEYVQRVGAALAADSERPNLPWTFRVVDDPTPNAFALPGGYIFLTRGLMNLMENEAEMASVLGHEIGHVTARHSVTALSRAQLAQLGLGVGMIFVPELQQFGQLAGTGMQLLFLKYGRDAEHQADELGFRYALEEGYDVRQMADVFASLQRVGEQSGQSPLPSWLSSHPYPAERIQRVEQRVAALPTPPDTGGVRGAEYLAQIEGMVYGENPRNGIFRGSTFLHPDLQFRMEFPQGWQLQNMPQAVIAASPRQDAAMQLTLAGQADPVTAARQFFGQQGIQAGPTSQQNINGLPGVVGSFQAQTQQGVIRGLVVFVAHGGRTYQLIGYTPAQAYANYDRLLQQSLGSFQPLTDPQILALQPNRLEIVRIDQPLTLAEFNQRYPSAVPIEELALINQVPDASARFPAGAQVKRVVAGSS